MIPVWFNELKDTGNSLRILGTSFVGNPEALAGGIAGRSRYARDLSQMELFYHEYLQQSAMPSANKVETLEVYLRATTSRVADHTLEWHPYSVSNRLIQWLKFLSREIETLDKSFALRMAEACLMLADYVDWLQEWDIEANHLLKNLYAIALVDEVLSVERPGREEAARLYCSEVLRQFLADGGHYELCPMYHAKALADLRGFRSIVKLPASEEKSLHELEGRALSWINAMRVTKDQVAHFNDSWDCPALEETLRTKRDGLEPRAEIHHLTHSGFARLRSPGGWQVIMDVGGVGPDFNPGHSHSDLCSIAAAFGEHVIVHDPGVLHYSPNDERAFLKSAKAHNGPCLADRDHTEMVGSFRVGRAARVRDVKILESEAKLGLSGGYVAPGGVQVRRTVTVLVTVLGDTLVVEDRWWGGDSDGTTFTPWLRFIWGCEFGRVSQHSLRDDGASLTFSLARDGRKQTCHVQQKAFCKTGVRVFMGSSHFSRQFGVCSPATETIIFAPGTSGEFAIETTIITANK